MKKTIISILIGSAAIISSAGCFATSGTANIHFRGAVASGGCNVQVNHASGDASVDMGTIDMSKVDVGGTSDAYPFEIELTNCPTSMNNAAVTFIGNSTSDNKYFAVNNSADSIGLAILITSAGQSSSAVLPNVQNTTGMVRDGNYGFKGSYSAKIVKLKDGVPDTSFDVSTAVNIAYM